MSLNPPTKTYVRTGRVNATPMTRGDYNVLRGWTVPEGENPDEAGFFLEEADHMSPNVRGFTGHVSWREKGFFNTVYKLEIPPHQQRVIDEHAGLSERLNKLREFMFAKPCDSVFMRLGEFERERLSRQEKAMREYVAVLAERIEAFA